MSIHLRWTTSILLAAFPSLAAEDSSRTARLWTPVEWKYINPTGEGNPFDLVAEAVFTHEPSGERITTELFYDGGGTSTWTLRFTGTRPGRWTFVTESSEPDLDGRTGRVAVEPNPGVPGFLTTFDGGRKWGKLGIDEAFVPQYVMYRDPDVFHQKPELIDADIETFLRGHGFNGFHVAVLCRWFDIHKTRYRDFSTRNPDPDPRTFEALELLITRTHAAGGTVHLWAWGDEQRAMTPVGFEGGKNGPVDRRLQRYIGARLGPLPGWSMGYGWDLQEWVSREDLLQWHTYMQAHLGWDHFLGGRSPEMTQIYDGSAAPAWFASYQQHRPDYDMYVKALEELHPGKPVFFTDRYRVRENVYPEKDYTPEMVRRGVWRSTMAGGAGNIWGYLVPDGPPGGGSRVFPNRDQILTWSRFFTGRFQRGMVRDNALTDGVCLRAERRLHVFYKEDAASLEMDLSGLPGPQPAIAVDARRPYTEIDLGMVAPEKQTWRAPWTSDWAVAVGRDGAPRPPAAPAPRGEALPPGAGPPESGEGAREEASSDGELCFWLENMLRYHGFTGGEIAAATGLPPAEVETALERFGLRNGRAPVRPEPREIAVLPYPGGRHPRIGFLEGAVDPQRGTKASVFLPWKDAGYVVVDLPEALWSHLGLTFLAHKHIPTIWDRSGVEIPRRDWTRLPGGGLECRRELPNGLAFTARIVPEGRRVDMELRLENGTREKLRGLRAQVCVLLGRAPAFNRQTNGNKELRGDVAAVRDATGRRWIVTVWERGRAWANPPVPCLHSDPAFPDLEPGGVATARGGLLFFDGEDLHGEIERHRAADTLLQGGEREGG